MRILLNSLMNDPATAATAHPLHVRSARDWLALQGEHGIASSINTRRSKELYKAKRHTTAKWSFCACSTAQFTSLIELYQKSAVEDRQTSQLPLGNGRTDQPPNATRQ